MVKMRMILVKVYTHTWWGGGGDTCRNTWNGVMDIGVNKISFINSTLDPGQIATALLESVKNNKALSYAPL
jgi:hypothetical protein